MKSKIRDKKIRHVDGQKKKQSNDTFTNNVTTKGQRQGNDNIASTTSRDPAAETSNLTRQSRQGNQLEKRSNDTITSNIVSTISRESAAVNSESPIRRQPGLRLESLSQKTKDTFISPKLTWTCPTSGKVMPKEDRIPYLRTNKKYVKTWHNAITKMTRKMSKSEAKQAVAKICRSTGLGAGEALCALALYKGDETAAIKRVLTSKEFRGEIELASDVCKIGTFFTKKRSPKRNINREISLSAIPEVPRSEEMSPSTRHDSANASSTDGNGTLENAEHAERENNSNPE